MCLYSQVETIRNAMRVLNAHFSRTAWYTRFSGKFLLDHQIHWKNIPRKKPPNTGNRTIQQQKIALKLHASNLDRVKLKYLKPDTNSTKCKIELLDPSFFQLYTLRSYNCRWYTCLTLLLYRPDNFWKFCSKICTTTFFILGICYSQFLFWVAPL